MNKVILIDIINPRDNKREALERLEELEHLVSTYGGFVIFKKIQKKTIPNYNYFLGTGKLEEIFKEAVEFEVNHIIINNILKPSQIRNIQELYIKYMKDNHGLDMKEVDINIEFWDRIDLILKIFQKHAKTEEAKLEIELASINHMGSRIFGMGMELSRQGGGVGTRGKGETNTRIMQSHLKKQRIKIQEKINEFKKTRELHREDRIKRGLKTISLVGYTNSGKSTLLKSLTKKDVYIADELFATLDTRVGKIWIQESMKECLLVDTIGFIKDLPTELINSFKSTLEETIYADLLFHVIDISDPLYIDKINTTENILKELLGEEKYHKKMKEILVFNKIDKIDDKDLEKIKNNIEKNKIFKNKEKIFISAISKINTEELKNIASKYI
ncbi:GTPase HflX [Patescibacteria group bacterium]|nr:GTPase HflX [Patescibacteria group bacterium]